MVTLTWGNVLAILLPGALTMFGLRFFHHSFRDLLAKPNELTVAGATFLLIAAALIGGVLDSLRRVIFEDRFKRLRRLVSRSASPATSGGLYAFVTPENLGLFETLVENSYRYYTFYGNLLCAIAIMLPMRFIVREANWLDVGLLGLAPLVGYAAYVQHDMFTAAMKGFMSVERNRRRKGQS